MALVQRQYLVRAVRGNVFGSQILRTQQTSFGRLGFPSRSYGRARCVNGVLFATINVFDGNESLATPNWGQVFPEWGRKHLARQACWADRHGSVLPKITWHSELSWRLGPEVGKTEPLINKFGG